MEEGLGQMGLQFSRAPSLLFTSFPRGAKLPFPLLLSSQTIAAETTLSTIGFFTVYLSKYTAYVFSLRCSGRIFK